MKKCAIIVGMLFTIPAFAVASSSATINATTVNVNATNVNITPSLSEQALLAQYLHPWWINIGAGLTTGFPV